MIRYERRYIKSRERYMYVALEHYTYFSIRFGKKVTITPEFISDGATGAPDIPSMSWWVHDALCDWKHWDDGTSCSVLDSSLVIYDILKAEGRYVRAPLWFMGTLVGRHLFNFGDWVVGKFKD